MLRRRLITIPGYAIVWALWLAAVPIWLPVTILVDLARRSRGIALRSAVAITVYLSCEIMGIVASGGLWAWKRIFPVGAERWTDIHFRLEAWWGTTLFRAAVRLFGLRLEVESDADLGRGPYLLMLRHASTIDTLLASALVSRAHGLRLRYVLKQELLWDPSLDIVGHRLPNVFVDRFSDESAHEIRRVQALARDLGPRDGILIYPEGTRFSEAKRRRVLERFNQKGDAKMLEYARSLGFVLPPRPGCAHTGFEDATTLAELWKGALVNQVIRVQFRRIPRDEIPTEREARVAWLLEEWRRVDSWVESHQSSGRR
jgi:1-acyl-sn-glycerol-3-phosphate acyltransferase